MAVLDEITIGPIQFIVTDANPDGVVTRSQGSLAVDSTNAKWYINTDGGTTWSERS